MGVRIFSIENHIFEMGSQVFKKKFTICFKNYFILAEKKPYNNLDLHMML